MRRPERAGRRLMRPPARLFCSALAAALLPGGCLAQEYIRAVRFWSLGDITRVAIETSNPVKYRWERLSHPDRLFFDLLDAVPQVDRKRIRVFPVGDRLLKQIRLAENQPGITRVVLDLNGPVEFSASQLANPSRLMIELRLPGQATAQPPARSMTGGRVFTEPREESRPKAETGPALPAPPKLEAKPPELTIIPVETARAGPPPAASAPPRPSRAEPLKLPAAAETGHAASPERPSTAGPAQPQPASHERAGAPAPIPPQKKTAEPSAELGLAAKTDSRGNRSLIRALGLKIERVVLDPGHGGHDTGTIGPGGLTEKELVLDIAKRLGKLIGERMGSEVIYTRTDDTFVPLETRTEIANDSKADLFLSIHANSSRQRSISGVETFYLNFTTSPQALEVAARENASSSRTIHELQDLVLKIARKEKVEESREFASTIQKALRTALRSSGSKDRGVKKAPFVVLIGARMPSVLVEIAFLSNPREERLLKRSDHRQRIAEALYKGLTQYAASLSHFEVARSKKF